MRVSSVLNPKVIFSVIFIAAAMTFLFGGSKPSVSPLSEQELRSSVQGKNFLIVGGTKGIGAALGESLTKRGAHVVVTGRSQSDETPSKAEFIKSDVSSLASARDLVTTALKDRKFDTVVMTVGIITRSTLTKTDEGIEEDLAVSYLSRFIILNELLKANAIEGRKRVFIMGYPGTDVAPVNIKDINFETTPYKQFPAHMNTVVFNEALVHSLARRHPDLHVFGLNPGLIKTAIRDNVHGGTASISGKILETLIGWTNPSATTYAEGALIHLMATPQLDSQTAKSFSRKMVEVAAGPWASDEANQDEAWKASQDLLSKQITGFPEY